MADIPIFTRSKFVGLCLGMKSFLQASSGSHCVKSAKCGVFSGPYFSILGLNTEIHALPMKD